MVIAEYCTACEVLVLPTVNERDLTNYDRKIGSQLRVNNPTRIAELVKVVESVTEQLLCHCTLQWDIWLLPS